MTNFNLFDNYFIEYIFYDDSSLRLIVHKSYDKILYQEILK